MAAIAQLKALLGMDATRYKAGMRDAGGATDRFQRQLSTVGRAIGAAFTVGAIVQATKSVVNFASEIRHVSDNLEINSTTLQSLNATALKYGMTVQGLEKGIAKLLQSQGKAIEGDKEYTDAVEALNINLEEFKAANPAEALELLARAYAGASDRALAFSAMSDLMGRSGKKATAFLKVLASEGVSELERQAIKTGRVIDDELITKLEKLGTRAELAKLKMKVLWAKTLDFVVNGTGMLTSYLGQLMGGNTHAEIMKNLVGERFPSDVMGDDIPTGTDAPKVDQAKIDKVNKANAALRRARLDGLEKLKAEFDAKMDDVIGQIRLTPQSNQALRRALFDQGEILRAAYDDDVRAFESAEEKKAVAIRKRFADQIASLEARGIYAHGQGVDAGGLASVGGSIGPSRPGLGLADRQLKLQMEGNEVRKQIEKLNREMAAALQQIGENTQPSGSP